MYSVHATTEYATNIWTVHMNHKYFAAHRMKNEIIL